MSVRAQGLGSRGMDPEVGTHVYGLRVRTQGCGPTGVGAWGCRTRGVDPGLWTRLLTRHRKMGIQEACLLMKLQEIK